MQNTYVTRCLQKTDDIRRLTDRMFEYALVYDVSEPEQIRMIPFSLSRLLGLFREQMVFWNWPGFTRIYPFRMLTFPTSPPRTHLRFRQTRSFASGS